MFRVYDGRKKRKSMVAKYAARDPFVGVLIAAADFEWTCRRAIQAMGKGSTVGIRQELFKHREFGLELNRGWEQQVRQKSKGVTKFYDIFTVWAKTHCDVYVIWSDIEYAMMWRNRLIHGIANDIGDAEGAKCVNILECACDILVQYLAEFGIDIYTYVGRGGMLSTEAEVAKDQGQERARKLNDARCRMKDECIICGIRIKKDKVKADLKISGREFERAMLQLSRGFGIKLLV